MKLTTQQLQRINGKTGGATAVFIITAINTALEQFAINTHKRAGYFLAQAAHESGHFKTYSENLNYSAEGLAKTWRRYRGPDGKPNALAKRLERNPEMIANNVYADRMGNGNEASGDGWRYRGAGWLQLTGKTNQLACADYFGIEHDKIGAWLRTPTGAALSAGLYWFQNGCNKLADKDDIDGISDIINIGHHTALEGDAIGYKDRFALSMSILKDLA